jgi:prepilin-type N-terminal cleavage/methylation domain-containing protein
MHSIFSQQKKQGFTLIELLIVIAIIGIIAAVIFVALNPLRRFQDSRDAVRWSDAGQIMEAIQVNQVDDGGAFIDEIENMDAGFWYMITDGNGGGDMGGGCDDNNALCDVNISGDTYCVDLDDLVEEGYLGDIPVSPAGTTTWDYGEDAGNEGTGYALYKSSTGALTIQACEAEDIVEIKIVR